jgi:hypothetical protein
MQYICTKRFKGKTLSQNHANIPYGTEFTAEGDFLYDSGKPMMAITSYNCHQHFARNDDGQGLRRGKLAYAIAFAPRSKKHSDGRYYRFSENEIDMLARDYAKYLKDTTTIIFNNDFFNAEINELEELAKKLNIKVKED